MSIIPQSAKFVETLTFLAHIEKHQPAASGQQLPPSLALLRTWQTHRLTHTHADLLADRRYGPACRFFLSDIYAARDFSQRDQDIEHLHAVMSRFLPDFLLSLVRKTIEMNSLTNELDQALLHALVEDLGVKDAIPPEQYAEAYRICNNYAARVRQIDLVVEVGRQVELGTRLPLVGATLRLARHPARHAGWNELQDFLERGYHAFKQMGGGARTFLETIQRREMRILDNIYAAQIDPFDL